MIKSTTFKSAQNFKANLYALEVKSRFIDQNNANGFYIGYGDELSATVIGTSGIKIGSGAFLVQGRMVEIVSAETVSIAYEEGKVGYIVCRIETNPAENVPNCTLAARTAASLSDISLTKEDVYAYNSEDTNKVYELALYSFGMQNTTINNVVKLISGIEEISEIKATADTAKSTADAAKSTADAATTAASNAVSTANSANTQSSSNATRLSAAETKLNNLGFRQSSSGGYSVNATLKRQGNYVIARLYCNSPSMYSEYYPQYKGGTIMTLPTYFRPKTTLTMTLGGYGSVMLTNSSYRAQMNNVPCYFQLTINTDGTVVFSTPIAKNGGFYLTSGSSSPMGFTAIDVCANVFDVSVGFEAPAIT